MKVKKKPVIVETVQWKGTNIAELKNFLGSKQVEHCGGTLIIPTLEGNMEAKVNDWIIKGVKGEFYPCKPDIFEETYERVD